jgi:hypothetical protein
MTLRFILAQLFEKLTVYWPMVSEIAGSFRTSNADELWSTFSYFIDSSGNYIRDPKSFSIDEDLKSMYGELDMRVDFWSFRLEIFKLLSTDFVWLAERKNRFLVTILFDIYE